MAESIKRKLMKASDIPAFVDDVIRAGCGICAVGQDKYVLGDGEAVADELDRKQIRRARLPQGRNCRLSALDRAVRGRRCGWCWVAIRSEPVQMRNPAIGEENAGCSPEKESRRLRRAGADRRGRVPTPGLMTQSLGHGSSKGIRELGAPKERLNTSAAFSCDFATCPRRAPYRPPRSRLP